MPEKFQKILVIKLRAIGDVILATPVLDNLAAAFPHAAIDFLTEPASAPIVQHHPALHDVIVLDRRGWAQLPHFARLRASFAFMQKLRDKKYDMVFDLFGNPRSALLTYFSHAPVRVGYKFRVRRLAYNHLVVPRGDRVHEVEFNLDALRALDIPIRTQNLRVEIAGDAQTEVAKWWREQKLEEAKPVIGLNASGGWYTKRWPLASFAQLGDRLARDCGATIILLWGSWDEQRDANEIARQMQAPARLAPPTDLAQAGALLARLHLLVSNDSGPMHLAAAMKTRVVGVYGPTRPGLQGPWGEGHQVVFKAGLHCLGCNGVTCKIKTHDCMQQLEVEEVLQAAKLCLQNAGSAAVQMT
ncbi:lipopolysaccharide heptosyltransferase II [candidate division KSB1 bacterium]|nr:MAG: lipopolysaccharide heptosyltransferase II [candidate division KSB1 bacterium]MBC6946914.1 lipopolysaccharide heptosyltransferase II [candidate division KSB1 bacterium]MCE7942877.1 lipopolysaccharide heptosyltransferase II [Chlorobi bacterium CHB1]